jgi:hypothetical protein
MPLSATPYTLTTTQLDAALAALAKAAETFRLSAWERFFYRVLQVCATITAIAILLTVVSAGVLTGCMLPVAMLTGVVAIVLLVANLTLLLKTSRQRRLLIQLGLDHLSHSAWKADRKRHWVRALLGSIVTIAGVVVLGISIVGGIVTAASPNVETLDFVLIAFFIVLGGTMLVWRSLERSRQRLELVADADRLRATLTSLQTDADANVVVPAPVLENVARIEQAQIARERTRAVLAGVSAADRGYAVQFAAGVSEQKSSLPVKSRLDLAELIDDLMANPYPSAAHAEGPLSARTVDGTAEVDYSVDEQNRRIHILALRTPAGESHAL